jgi:hypothetical protein
MTITPETIAVVIAAVALGAAVVLAFQVAALRSKLEVIPEDGDIFEAVRGLDRDLTSAEAAIAEMQPVVESLARRMPFAVRHTAVIAYDATQQRTGNLSRSIAMLNERLDGLVITLLHGRQETLFFTKMVRRGEGVEPLSPEEQEAIDQASVS